MRFFIILAVTTFCSFIEATVVGYSSSVTGARFIRVINDAVDRGIIDLRDFRAWSDLESLPVEFQSKALNGIADLPNLSDYYFIIPPDKRFRSDNGIAYLALSEPLSYDQLEADIHAKEEGKSLEDLPAVDRSDEFRWIIYLQDDGYLIREKMSESAFQDLFANHGVDVEPPNPYRFNVSRFMAEMNEPASTNLPEEALVAKDSGAVLSTERESISSESVEVVKEPIPEKTPPSVWPWLVGVLVLLTALGLVFTRKRS